MRKLFGYCLLNQAELKNLVNTIEGFHRQLGEAWRERRQLEERIEDLEARLSSIRTTKIDVIARRRQSEREDK